MAYSYKCTNPFCNQDFPVQDESGSVVCPYCSTLYYLDNPSQNSNQSPFGTHNQGFSSLPNTDMGSLNPSPPNFNSSFGVAPQMPAPQGNFNPPIQPDRDSKPFQEEYVPPVVPPEIPMGKVNPQAEIPSQNFSGPADLPYVGQNPYSIPDPMSPVLIPGLDPRYSPGTGQEAQYDTGRAFDQENPPETASLGTLVSKKGHFFKLKEGRNVLGRKGTDFIIEDLSVSRKHCVIEVELGKDKQIYYYVSDAGRWDGKPSTNGVFLSTRSMRLNTDERIPVYPGITIKIGNVELLLQK